MSSLLTYDGPATLVANQLFTAVLRVELGVPLAPGGKLVLAQRHTSDAGRPQTDDPAAENYLTVRTPRPCRWRLAAAAWNAAYYRHPWNSGIELELLEGSLQPGDTIAVRLGDPSGGCPGFRCQSFVETHSRYRLGIDPDGSGQWEVLSAEDCPAFEIVGARPVRIVPFVAGVNGETLHVHLKPEDAYGNVAGEAAGEVSLMLEDGRPLARVSLAAGEPAGVTLPAPGDGNWHRLTVAGDDGAFFARSNPFGPGLLDGYRLFWGEIHCQSGLCDGTNSPAYLYHYARRAAGLDFAAVSSHDMELTAEDWREITDATRAAHQPGRFVTFLGYEWSGMTKNGGDNNIYFLDDEGPLVYNGPWTHATPGWDPSEGQADGPRTLAETIAVLKAHGRPFMVVPHCGGRRCNFDFFDPGVMPMFEIHSNHRTFEPHAFDMLRRGLPMGFVGGSDDHRGALGDSHVSARDTFFSAHNGLVAVYARELTRASLWEAFFARRVYATSGARIALDFRVNGVPMGGELAVPAGNELCVTIRAHLDGLLDVAELFRGEEVIGRFTGGGNINPSFATEHRLPVALGRAALFVRVRQTDGGTAWSSPVWVEGKTS
jgi:hypothetical protein